MTDSLRDVAEAIHAIKARALAHDALFNIVFRCWGRSAQEVIAHLHEAAERVQADLLHSQAPEAAVEAARNSLELAQTALAARLRDG